MMSPKTPKEAEQGRSSMAIHGKDTTSKNGENRGVEVVGTLPKSLESPNLLPSETSSDVGGTEKDNKKTEVVYWSLTPKGKKILKEFRRIYPKMKKMCEEDPFMKQIMDVTRNV